jgi:hypothetical protein
MLHGASASGSGTGARGQPPARWTDARAARTESIRRLDADDERDGGNRQVAEVAGGQSTASFSVVSTMAAAADRAASVMRRMSRASNRVVIAEVQGARDLPTGSGHVGHEPIRTRDAGDDEHARIGRHHDRLATAGQRARRRDGARDAKNGRDAERAPDPFRGRVIPGGDERGIRGGRRRDPFAQPSNRQRPIREVVLRREQQIDVPRQLEVLKPIVEEMDGDTELAFGEDAGEVTVGANQDGNTRKGARQHQRLVASGIEIGVHRRAVRHDRDAIERAAPCVPSRQDRGPLAAVEEETRDIRHHRRLARCRRRAGCRR